MARTKGTARKSTRGRGDAPRDGASAKAPTRNIIGLDLLDGLFNLKSLRLSLKDSLVQGGSLEPIVSLLGGGQLQAMLLAWIPVRFGSSINTGIYAVDMFVTTLIVTVVVALLSFVGTQIKKVIETEPTDINASRVVSVRVDYYRADRYGELIVNLHYEALAWLISQRSRQEKEGEFRMVPYDPESGNSPQNYDYDGYWYSDDDDDESGANVPDFNILPRGANCLIIQHNKCKFFVYFEQPNDDVGNNNETKPSNYNEKKLKTEPPIIIQRALKEERKDAAKVAATADKSDPTSTEDDIDLPEPTLEWMQQTLNGITKLYLDQQSKRRARGRYERGRGGGWYRSSDIHACRGLGSVALDRLQQQLLKKDLESFHSDKAFYERMGLPYRRGYLFSGRPGTGKTSLINAISASYNRDLYYINLKEIQDDAALNSSFNSVPKDAIIVFEDVDAQSAVVHSRERRSALRNMLRQAELKAAREKREKKEREKAEKRRKKLEKRKAKKEAGEEDEEGTESEDEEEVVESSLSVLPPDDDEDTSSVIGMDDFGGGGFGGLKFGKMVGFGADGPSAASLLGGFTLSTLLNCLDGHTLAEGTIIIMSSNHPEVLDPALIRPGRIDLHLQLGYCTQYQLTSMYRSVMDDPTATPDMSAIPEH
ncbi:mitochondrial chaperone, partial [Borealophlyctis nickersoniae]